MSVRLWKPGDPIPSDAPLYFRAADESSARTAYHLQGNAPLTVRVAPNGEALLGFIHGYILAQERQDHAWVTSVDLGQYEFPTRSILIGCTEIVRGLRDYSSERVGAACGSVEQQVKRLTATYTHCLPQHLTTAIGCIADFARDVLSVLEYGSPFVHTRSIPANKDWWSNPPSLLTRMQHFSRAISGRFGLGSVPSGLIELSTWLNETCDRLKRLTATRLTTRDDAMLEASAYCSAMAERYLLRGNCGLAVLLLHRSADLLLLRTCAMSNVIDFTSAGGKYKQGISRSGDRRIHLVASVDIANTFNFLSPSQARTDALGRLNEWRMYRLGLSGHSFATQAAFRMA